MTILSQMFIAFLAAAMAIPANAGDILLESFDEPAHHWKQMNDPVMGGKSTGTFKIEDGVGIFDGEVVDVPFLHAPGFIKVQSRGRKPYADVSSCQALKLTLRSSVNYDGYRVSFGNAHPPNGKFFAYGYKAGLKVPHDAEEPRQFNEVEIRFNEFSDLWDDATGEQIKTCKEHAEYCPDEKTLKNMKTISIWAEGVAGKVHLEVKSISATGCSENVEQAY
ncbi:expressed unknown protein [Seminavis robusta]|uniref:NADH:ubiquinone oxidoreductase intermediate-associated protein 30 domain-containing protein n=1 Tax=Seminavis robusta TaxID=568900 RepID=A0A9N8HV20_9STRA|nr:expressed unknown protein [Seminavis robusta]|eukprot:Sro1453_g274030.1 n/a (221) ;mRNA; r:18551-19369